MHWLESNGSAAHREHVPNRSEQSSSSRAYVDESARAAAPGLYLLAAVVVSAEQAEDVRHVLRDGLR